METKSILKFLVNRKKKQLQQNICQTFGILLTVNFMKAEYRGVYTKLTFTCSKSTIEKLEEGVKYIQS